MTALVNPDEVLTWVPAQPEDEILLARLAELATGIVLDYCGPDPATGAARTWTVDTVPDPVRAAILHCIAEMWAHRGDSSPVELLTNAAIGHLSPPVVRLLQRFREPIVS